MPRTEFRIDVKRVLDISTVEAKASELCEEMGFDPSEMLDIITSAGWMADILVSRRGGCMILNDRRKPPGRSLELAAELAADSAPEDAPPVPELVRELMEGVEWKFPTAAPPRLIARKALTAERRRS